MFNFTVENGTAKLVKHFEGGGNITYMVTFGTNYHYAGTCVTTRLQGKLQQRLQTQTTFYDNIVINQGNGQHISRKGW